MGLNLAVGRFSFSSCLKLPSVKSCLVDLVLGEEEASWLVGGSEKIGGEDQVLLDGKLPLPWVQVWEITAVLHRKSYSGRTSV